MPKNLNIDEEYQNQKDLIAAIRGNQTTRDLQKNKTFKSKNFKTKKTKGVLEQLPAEYQNLYVNLLVIRPEQKIQQKNYNTWILPENLN